ncbi:MAG: AsmA-like C-terminal domain-containing protein, partial [Candidatus Puniceispirillaceae bacterium]
AIEDIDIEAGSLAMVGRAGFAAPKGNGITISEASFRRLGWPGNDIGMLELSRDVDGDWLITAEAKLIDLVPLRRNRGIGKGRPVSFDILAERIILGDGLSLSGHISGNKKAAGGGEASFSGNLSHRTRTLISEGEFQMSFGSGGEFLNGVGIVGGAETTLTYSAAEGEVPELTMSSENGGGTLAGLTVTDTIRSGEMFLRTKFIDGFENFDTNIRITNFTVVEAPRAVRAFSVLAPTGLYSLVEGQGTGFDWGEASIEKRGPKVNLTQVTGRGQAVSVAFVGQYDDETREVDVSGNLVPASFLSQIIGVIPIVGEILTGVDNAGLFVTQFSLTGSIDDPDASITPASVVPGVLRDLFSPSWLRREGDRILGPDANGGVENGG